jgi:hypothetical protein
MPTSFTGNARQRVGRRFCVLCQRPLRVRLKLGATGRANLLKICCEFIDSVANRIAPRTTGESLLQFISTKRTLGLDYQVKVQNCGIGVAKGDRWLLSA